MATCEKCGRALDDEYAKEWHWCTECRAKAGSAPFGNCEICGKALYENEKGGICSTCLQNAEELYESEKTSLATGEELSEQKGCGCSSTAIKAIVFLVATVAIFAIIISTGSPSETDAKSPPPSSAVQSQKAESEYETKRTEEFNAARKYARKAIMDIAANPGTVAISEHDKNRFKGRGVFFYDFGKVRYTDSAGNAREEPYEYAYITTYEHFISCYLKIGNNIIYDYTSFIDSKTGTIISPDFSINGHTYGQPALEGKILSSKDWDTPSVVGDGKISLSEFYKIENGMTLDEVLEIIGGGGTIAADSEMGGVRVVIVTWDGVGQIGANASVTFQNGRVVSKAQAGLE